MTVPSSNHCSENLTRILLVDNDNIFSTALADFLFSKPVIMTSVANLQEAKQTLASAPFDILLLENRLADAQGIVLLESISSFDNQPAVIMITAQQEPDFIARCFALGVDEFMLKPVNFTVLWEKIRQLAAKSKSVDALAGNKRLKQQETEQQIKEVELTRAVYSKMARLEDTPPAGIANLTQSEQGFSSTSIFSLEQANGNILVFMADPRGHGLSAAICLLPLVMTARAMAKKGASVQVIMHEINAKLFREIPKERQISLIAVEIAPLANKVRIINAGTSHVLVCDEQRNIHDFAPACGPIGQIEPEKFNISCSELALDDCQHMFFLNQSMVNQVATMYAEPMKHIVDVVSVAAKHQHWQTIVSKLIANVSVDEANIQNLSCYSLDMAKLLKGDNDETAATESLQLGGDLSCAVELTHDAIRHYSAMDVFTQMLQTDHLLCSLRQRTFTVLSELTINAIDHGILKLDSTLKNDFSGFSEYLEERERRLSNLSDSDVLKIKIQFRGTDEVEICVEDSGEGYLNYENGLQNINQLQGRGLSLVHQISDEVSTNQAGNITSAIIRKS